MKRGDLVFVMAPPGWCGKLGLVLREGFRAPGWQVFWVHVPRLGTFSFEPSDLQELP
jgi:hypothetical protein